MSSWAALCNMLWYAFSDNISGGRTISFEAYQTTFYKMTLAILYLWKQSRLLRIQSIGNNTEKNAILWRKKKITQLFDGKSHIKTISNIEFLLNADKGDSKL